MVKGSNMGSRLRGGKRERGEELGVIDVNHSCRFGDHLMPPGFGNILREATRPSIEPDLFRVFLRILRTSNEPVCTGASS